MVPSHTFFPVIHGDLDHLTGLVKAQDLLMQLVNQNHIRWTELLQKPLRVGLKTPVLTVLENFEDAKHKLALVIDTEGKVQGLITQTDILQVIAGQISSRLAFHK